MALSVHLIARYAGVPVAAAAAAARVPVDGLRALRDQHGRCTEDGMPRARARRKRRGLDLLEHDDWDALMRSNRGVL
jgi:hypothetical protein